MNSLPPVAGNTGDDQAPGGIPKFPKGFKELPAGTAWQEIPVDDGAALCARGTPFSFFVHAGDPNKLVVNFAGGGACASAESCDVSNPTFFPNNDILRVLVSTQDDLGAFAEHRDDNPFKGWTHLVIPNCSGDLNLGGRDATYQRQDGSTFVVYHRGAANNRAALKWLDEYYKKQNASPSRVTVIGSSAGAYASVMWTPAIQKQFPRAEVRQLGDCGAGVLDPLRQHGGFPAAWNIVASLPTEVPGLDPAADDVSHLTTDDLYVHIAQAYPQIQFAQFSYNRDPVQSYFFLQNGGDAYSWTPRFYASMVYLKALLPNFHVHIADGDGHAIFVEKALYELKTNGEPVKDWVTDYVTGKAPRDQITGL